MAKTPQQGSTAGRLFRRLADWFDRAGERSKFAGTRREVEIITSFLLCLGIIVVATLIYGWRLFHWSFLFAVLFSIATFFIFRSSRWRSERRGLFIIAMLLASLVAVPDRLLALVLFIVLFLLLMQSLLSKDESIHRDSISVIAILLLCFTAYAGFSGLLEMNRNANMKIKDTLTLHCTTSTKGKTTCQAREAEFDVPEFWHQGGHGVLVKDLSGIASFSTYQDTATDNTIAIAAFSSAAPSIMQSISNYFYVQKSFLRGHGLHHETLVPQQMVKSADTELYSLRYEAVEHPGYLGNQKEYYAFLLLHRIRNTTWLVVVDGAEAGDREYLLHRIISGFR